MWVNISRTAHQQLCQLHMLVQVAGACLYIFCRQEQKPFMLIDISDVLQINVFALGAVFLQMCHILHLENQPMFFRYRPCSAPSAQTWLLGELCVCHCLHHTWLLVKLQHVLVSGLCMSLSPGAFIQQCNIKDMLGVATETTGAAVTGLPL